MRGREKIRRGRFAGKEQPAVDRRGQHGALAGVAGQRVRIGAARERDRGPSAIPPAASACGENRCRARLTISSIALRGQRAVAGVFQLLAQSGRRKSLRCRAGRTGAGDRCPSRCAWWRRADCRPSAALRARPAPASPCRRGRAAGRARRRLWRAARDESGSLHRRSDWSAR